MHRRSFLTSALATIAVWLLPKRGAFEKAERVADEYAIGPGEPCVSDARFESVMGGSHVFTPDGGFTWVGASIPWLEADIEFERRMREISMSMAHSARESLEAWVIETLEGA